MDISYNAFPILKQEDYIRVPVSPPFFRGCGDWRALSLVRNKPTWIEAKLYPTLRSHAYLASSLLLLKSPDWKTTICVYPASGISANIDLLIDTKGDQPVIQANARRCIPGENLEVFVICVKVEGEGREREIVKRAVEEARRMVHSVGKFDGDLFFKGLGVCTWESLKHSNRPTKDNLLELIPDLPIQTFLIDDGWQDVTKERHLMSFHEWDGMGAPMSEIIQRIKDKGKCQVGVWVTLQGYWLAIDPKSPLIKKYNCVELKKAKHGQPRGGVNIPLYEEKATVWLPHPDMAEKFWVDYFTELKDWGIGFVKVDNQAFYDTISAPMAPHVGQAMWSGMLSALRQVWGTNNNVIMCMSHNERMLNGPGGLDSDRPPGNLVFRNSDDYNLSYDTTHPDHVKNNLYSNILTSHLSLIPDYDMFASNPPDLLPTYHALLRVFGPGPVLLSDTPEVKTDYALVSRMLGTTITGSQVVARTDTPAQVLPSRWFWDNLQGEHSGPALLAGVAVPKAQGALIGSWNLRDPKRGADARDQITKRDVQEALGVDQLDGEYVVYSMGLSSENGSKVELFNDTSDRTIPFVLKRGECEGWIIAKVWSVAGKKLAVVGLLDKLVPFAGVTVITASGDGVLAQADFQGETISVLQIGGRKDLQIAVNSQPQLTTCNSVGEHTVSSIKLDAANAGAAGKWEVHIS